MGDDSSFSEAVAEAAEQLLPVVIGETIESPLESHLAELFDACEIVAAAWQRQ